MGILESMRAFLEEHREGLIEVAAEAISILRAADHEAGEPERILKRLGGTLVEDDSSFYTVWVASLGGVSGRGCNPRAAAKVMLDEVQRHGVAISEATGRPATVHEAVAAYLSEARPASEHGSESSSHRLESAATPVEPFPR